VTHERRDGFFDKLRGHALEAWARFRSGGVDGAADYAIGVVRYTLGVSALAARVDRAASAAATWTMMGWIDQAAVDPTVLVSVILPTHDRAVLLPRAIASVRAQVHPAWELVVVDDGSTDDTPAILRRLGDEIGADRMRVLRIPNAGVCAARNVALRNARGSLITYLDDDNVMHPLWLKAVAWAFAQRPDVDVVYGGIIVDDVRRVNREGSGALPEYYLHPFDAKALANDNLADIGAIAHRHALPEATFDEGLREMGDWDLLVRLTRDKPPLVLPMIACFYHTSAPERLSGGPTHRADAARVRARAR
jgi:hypothetical protein